MTHSKLETQDLAKKYAEQGKPNDWFEEFYARAHGEYKQIYWADLEANPLLMKWLKTHPKTVNTKAIIIGCGLGDDAEALAHLGYQVTAFDISESAINMCRKRYPGSKVNYRVADLFNYPRAWQSGFDLVYECNTIQILVGEARDRALKAIAELLAPGGEVIVSCRSRNKDEGLDIWPLALDRNEIDGFKRRGLNETHFLSYDDEQNPPVPHFYAVYQRPVGDK